MRATGTLTFFCKDAETVRVGDKVWVEGFAIVHAASADLVDVSEMASGKRDYLLGETELQLAAGDLAVIEAVK